MTSKLKMYHPYTKQEFIDSIKAVLAETEIPFVVRNALSVRLEWVNELDDKSIITWEVCEDGQARPLASIPRQKIAEIDQTAT